MSQTANQVPILVDIDDWLVKQVAALLSYMSSDNIGPPKKFTGHQYVYRFTK